MQLLPVHRKLKKAISHFHGHADTATAALGTGTEWVKELTFNKKKIILLKESDCWKDY